MDTAKQWTAENPVGTRVRLRGTKTELTVASHAFWPPRRGPHVLLSDGGAIGIELVERIMMPNAASEPRGKEAPPSH